jgi:hypothetical protein
MRSSKLSKAADDTFLLAHKILPLCYSFSAPISPISIRDQMIRAAMFVDHAVSPRSNLLGKGKNLLVIGGGAAGVSVAIEAARRDIEVVLIERHKRVFDLQRKAPKRWIDPAQYDWPFANWIFDTYPCPSPLLPGEKLPDVAMRWPAGEASLLAQAWATHLKGALADPKGLLTVHFRTRLLKGFPKRSGSELEARFKLKNGIATGIERFGCAVFALGFGNERRPAGGFRGFRYWDSDPWDEPDLRRPDKADQPMTIAICGSGDGALQDFLRIVTGLKSAKELMKKLEPLLPPQLAMQLAAEEDNSRRHHAWLHNPDEDHAHLKRLHLIYVSAVAQTLPLLPVQKLLDDACGPILKRLTINLYYSCDHFSQCFPLNHFLVLLILTWGELKGLTVTGTDKVRLDGVTGVAPHVCNEDKMRCHQSTHELTLIPAPVCGKHGGKGFKRKADIVIVRLGTDAQLGFPLFKDRSIPRTRQLLPYTPPLQ